MSDLYRESDSHAVHAGLTIDIAEESLTRVTKLLAGIRGGAFKAVGSALARAAAAGKTAAKRPVTQEYAISSSQFLKSTKNINHFRKEAGGEVSVVFGFRGDVIPLLKFNTRVGKNGLVSTQVKRSGKGTLLAHAFPAHLGEHRGIYERIGSDRFPVRELYGPATPQMMYSNKSVLDEMEHKIVETYETRIEHEILRLLNGWGDAK